jgi:hypothetical protein
MLVLKSKDTTPPGKIIGFFGGTSCQLLTFVCSKMRSESKNPFLCSVPKLTQTAEMPYEKN